MCPKLPADGCSSHSLVEVYFKHSMATMKFSVKYINITIFLNTININNRIRSNSDRVNKVASRCKGSRGCSLAEFSTLAEQMEQKLKTRLPLPLGWSNLVVPIADLGVVKPPRKLQRDLTRAAHALVFQRLMQERSKIRRGGEKELQPNLSSNQPVATHDCSL